MTNKLISLVIITFILSIGHSYSDEQFLLPKEKPSIFKKINKDPGKNFSSNLPQKKPLINQKKDQKKEVTIKNEEVIKEKKEIKNILNSNDKKIFEDHEKYNCIHFVILDNKNILKPCYFVVKKVRKYRIAIIDILYISNFKQYQHFAPEIFTKISYLFKVLLIGQRYFKEDEKLKNNFLFLSRTVEKYVPIKKFDDFYVFDTLYSDYVLFD